MEPDAAARRAQRWHDTDHGAHDLAHTYVDLREGGPHYTAHCACGDYRSQPASTPTLAERAHMQHAGAKRREADWLRWRSPDYRGCERCRPDRSERPNPFWYDAQAERERPE